MTTPKEFKVPARGQGTAKDWRAAGKAIGADLADQLLKAFNEAQAAGRLTPENVDAVSADVSATADKYVAELTARGHEFRMLVTFKTAMLKALRDEFRRLGNPGARRRRSRAH